MNETTPALPRLAPGYRGPLLLVTAEALRPDPVHTPIGAPEMLESVADLHVPLVYLPTDGKQTDLRQFPRGTEVQAAPQAYLQTLKSRFPNARFFVLAGNAGSDMRLAQEPGLTPYLRNTDFYQRDMPRDWSGIVTDEYFKEFRDRLLQDLQRAQGVEVGPSLPVYPNPPPMPRPNGHSRLRRAGTQTAWGTSGAARIAALGMRHRIHNRQDSLALARSGDLQGASPEALGEAADDLLQSTRLPEAERSQLLHRVLTGHGQDQGHIDSVVSRMRNPEQTLATVLGKIENVLRGPDRLAWTSHLTAGAPIVGDWKGDFEHYLDGLTGTQVEPGNRVHVSIDGEDAFQQQIEAIRNARKVINISTFVFASDQFARFYLSELEKAAQRGVKINLIVDQVGSEKTYGKLPTDPHLFDKLKQLPNVQFVQPPASPLHDHINHRKIMTMDNGQDDGQMVGFIGGMNIANDYRIRWHDVHCKVEGPAVLDLNRAFAAQLREYGGDVDADTEARMLTPQTRYEDGHGLRVVPHWGFRDKDLKMAYLRAIATAKDSIDIADPYVSDPDILRALVARAKEGVKVRLFVPQHNNHASMKWATCAHYKDMLNAGVEIYEYAGHEMAHEKVAVFDHQTTTIGSSNLDARSMQDNEEANIWSTDPELARDVEERLFNTDVPQCVRITDYNPGPVQATQTRIASLFNPLL